MKEATGELSTTVITIVAIAAISTLFIVFLYPQLKANIILNQACSNGPGYSTTNADGGYGVNCGDPATGDAVPTANTPNGYGKNTREKICKGHGEGETSKNNFKCIYGES